MYLSINKISCISQTADKLTNCQYSKWQYLSVISKSLLSPSWQEAVETANGDGNKTQIAPTCSKKYLSMEERGLNKLLIVVFWPSKSSKSINSMFRPCVKPVSSIECQPKYEYRPHWVDNRCSWNCDRTATEKRVFGPFSQKQLTASPALQAASLPPKAGHSSSFYRSGRNFLLRNPHR